MTSDATSPGASSKMHPRYALDEVIHSPVRLSIMAALARVGEMDFATLGATVEVSDSLLSKHIRQLEERNYVTVSKGYVGRRPRTWFALSDIGRTAFARYQATLRHILDDGDPNSSTMSEQRVLGQG